MRNQHKKKISGMFEIFLWGLLLLMLVINFVGNELFELSHFAWHLFLHIGIIMFSFGILIYSLRLNELARRYLISGGVVLIIVNFLLFFSHIFKEYIWLESNLFMFLGIIIGVCTIMFGLKEAVK